MIPWKASWPLICNLLTDECCLRELSMWRYFQWCSIQTNYWPENRWQGTHTRNGAGSISKYWCLLSKETPSRLDLSSNVIWPRWQKETSKISLKEFSLSVKFFKADPRTKFDWFAANKRPFHTCHNFSASQTVPKEDSKLAQAQPLTPEDRAANAKKQPQSEDSPSSLLDKFSFDNRPQRQSSDESNELNNQDTLRIGDQVTKLR